MTTINDLCVTSSFSPDDKLPMWSNANGVTRALPLSVLTAGFLTQDSINSLAASATVETFTSGANFTPGTTTSLMLAHAYLSKNNIEVFFDSSFQGPDQYTLVGQTLAFISPIPVGVQSVYVRGGATRVIGAPGDGTVTDASIAQGSDLYNRVNDVVAIHDLGAPTGGDDSAIFQQAINSLPATGGTILVHGANYVINTAPNIGTKNVLWMIDPNSTFSGAAQWPRMATNQFQMPVGPWLQSQSSQASPALGGIAGFNIEMVQPSSYVGQSESCYIGARGAGPNANSNVWALNTLVQADPGAGGIYQSIEADANNFSASARVKGVSVTGVGTFDADVAFECVRADSTFWKKGLHVLSSRQAIVVNNPSDQSTYLPNFNGQQQVNGSDCVILQRHDDSGAGGNFLRAVNAANNTNLVNIDVLGNAFFAGTINALNLQAQGAALPVSGAGLSIGNGVTFSATAGGAVLPAAPVGFLGIMLGSIAYKIPFYSA